MRQLDAAASSALTQRTIYPAFLIDFKFDGGTLSIASTIGDITANSRTYSGGLLSSVGGFEESLQLDPSECSVVITGLDNTIKAAILAEDYVNRPVDVWIVLFNSEGVAQGSPVRWFAGFMSSLSISYGASSDINIGLGDRMELWNRPKVRRYTDADQKSRYPTDKGLEFVEQVATAKVVWPTASFLKKIS